MESQSLRKISWLAILSLGIGILSFLSGIPILVLFISLAMTKDAPSSILDLLIEAYFAWVSILDLSKVVSIAAGGLGLGLLSLILNIIASRSTWGNLPRRIAFVSNILAALGIVGNGVAIRFFIVMTVQ